MNGGGKEGNTTTANFLSGMLKSIPPFEDVFNMAGLQLPEYLTAKNKEKEAEETPKSEGLIEEATEVITEDK